MQLYIQIDANTGFKKGDVIADSCEVCTSCDGDRSSFASHVKLVLRPIDSDGSVTEQRKLVSAKLRKMMEKEQALVAFAEGEAYCPCCTGVRECDTDCTIKQDCESAGGDAWGRYERMMAARDALSANMN